jgi:hypothetical protein
VGREEDISVFADRARQRFHLLTDNGCRLVRLPSCSRAELPCLDRHTGNSPTCPVAVLEDAAPSVARPAREYIRISPVASRSACPSGRRSCQHRPTSYSGRVACSNTCGTVESSSVFTPTFSATRPRSVSIFVFSCSVSRLICKSSWLRFSLSRVS